MASAVLANLGQLHVVTGRIVWTTGAPALTCNDASATVADTGTGNATVTFGDAFLSAPQATVSYLKATNSDTVLHYTTIEQCSTTALEVRTHTISDTGAGTTDVAAADPADTDAVMFIVVGMRNK